MNDLLTIIADNEALAAAVKDVLLKQFDLRTLDTSPMNEQLGERVRAYIEAQRGIEAAFKEIGNHRSFTPVPPPTNPAR